MRYPSGKNLDLENLKVGDSFTVFFGKGNSNNYRSHIRGIIDQMLVCRRWVYRKKRWSYEVIHPRVLDVLRPYLKKV